MINKIISIFITLFKFSAWYDNDETPAKPENE